MDYKKIKKEMKEDIKTLKKKLKVDGFMEKKQGGDMN